MANYNGSITLASVDDGTSGVTLYTWIRYSNGAATNPSVTDTVQSDTKQIGFAYNKTSSTASSNYSDYEWSDYIGTDGYNQATLYIYLRSSTAPTISGTSTYTFSTHTLTNIPTDWSQTIPATDANKTPCYVSSGVAVSRSDSVSVTWSTPTKLVEDGANGIDAVEVILSNESHTLTANAAGTINSYTGAYTDVYIYEGITDKSSDYTITKTDPSGVTSTVSGKRVTVTNVSNGIGGIITITVKKSSTTIATKQFTISVSKAGSGINTVTITYGYSTSGTDASTVTNWTSSIPSVPQGQYLWTRTVTTFTDGSASKTTYSVSRIGVDGEDGDLYRVDTNYEDIYRTKRWNDQSTPPAEETSYSPTTLTFKVYEVNQTEPLVCNTDYKFDVSILYNDPETNVDTDNIYTFITSLTGTNPFSLSADNKTISFNINNFMSLTSTNSTNQTRIEKIQTLVRTSDVYFILSILDPSSTVGTPSTYKIFRKRVFSVINALTSSLASFSTTANSINMAVRDTKMDFTGDGLRITNGTFSVEKVENNVSHQVLSFNPNTGELYVEGTGIFTGDIYAENGTFGGTLSAARGTFKGNLDAAGGTFKGELTAASGTFKGELTAATGSFEGTITAKEGEIGGFKIGATSLYANKPSGATPSNSNLVLDSNTPSIKLGNLSLNGDTSTISGTSFSITPDLAEFKNINISGKISASVFEINKTQAVGGSMIFKPSFKVESFTNNTLTVSGSLSGVLSSSQYVLVVDENGDSIASHIKPSTVSGSTVTFSGTPFTGKKPISLIVLGTDNDIIIGINSYNSNSLLLGQGLTIREYNHLDTTGNSKPKLFLGNLAANNSIIGNGVSGYGLYADNVVLNGSLTTIITNTTSQTYTYAGVNTLSPVQATKFDNDSTNVVFWAGSAGTGAQEISEAPFQVTEKGSLYAAQGKFEGAIITRSEIQGVDIYGARIHGTGNNPGLGVYNTTNGITFYRGDYGNNPVETFSIGSTGLQFNGSYFINVGGTGNIDFTGDEFHGNSFISTGLIQGTTLVASDANGSNTITSSQITNSNSSYIEFGNAININVKGSQTSQLQLEQSRGVFNTEYLVTQKNLQVGNNGNSAMRFMQVSGGYDLYVA